MVSKESVPFDSGMVFQIGIVVKDIEKTIKFYEEVFGIGPFERKEVHFSDATYYGETCGYRGKRAFAKMGPFSVELIELIEGKTIHEDFLKEKGEGLHHLGFEVKDLKKGMEIARQHGLQITQSYVGKDGFGFAYVDSDKIGGAIFELIQWAPKKDEAAEKNAK